MPFETSKAMMRRLFDRRFATTYFVGDGIDVGCGPDPLMSYAEMLPLMKSCRPWDQKDGDGALLESVKDESFDFLHSSHCLEHLDNPVIAMENWIRVVKKGGHLVILLPDEDLFEQGVWPSRYSGPDHKTSWTIYKNGSWCPHSINLTSFLLEFTHAVTIHKIELLDSTYFYNIQATDQTRSPIGECAIEVILRKKTDKEIEDKGRLPPAAPPAMFVYKT
jgi:SAM-dependent methyltransferase